MAETKMPAAEAANERNSYELAFHILPTVAEGEVPNAFEALKASITKIGGEITTEEAPQRIDLVYDIVKPIEGKNRKFSSAYFGWVRFSAESETIEALQEEVDSTAAVLRYLLIKLTKAEEANPFRYHEDKKADKMVEVIEEGDVLADPLTVSEEEKKAEADTDSDSKSETTEEAEKTEEK